MTNTLTGPLGARFLFTSELSRADPISSERISRNQYVAYKRHSVSGPENLGALPPLWLQARLTLSLTAIQEKFACILLSAAQRAVVARATSHCRGCPPTSCKGSHNSIGREASPGAEFIDAIG